MIKRLDPRKDNGRVIKFNLILLPWTQDVVYTAFMPYEQILKLRFDSALRWALYVSYGVLRRFIAAIPTYKSLIKKVSHVNGDESSTSNDRPFAHKYILNNWLVVNRAFIYFIIHLYLYNTEYSVKILILHPYRAWPCHI